MNLKTFPYIHWIIFQYYNVTIPVLTWSPVCNSDIATDLPFSTFTLARNGKQLFFFGGGGGGGGAINSH